MDFSLSEEQQLFSDSLRRLLSDYYRPEQRLDLLAHDTAYNEALWQQYAELGFLGLPFAENLGGFGGNAIDTMLAAIELCRALALEPFLASVILGGQCVKLAGNSEQQQTLLAPMIAGTLKLAAAFAEPQARYDLADVTTRAEVLSEGYRLSGHKAVVLGADCADYLIVSARTSGADYGEHGLSLFIVARDTPGFKIHDYRLTDGRGAAELELQQVIVDKNALLGELDQAYPIVDQVADLATSALCAEALGAMQVINDMTLEYLKTRQQFGRAIGKFQVLQHRMVDMMIELEQARSLTYLAAMQADNNDRTVRNRAVSAAKVQMGESSRFIAQNAIQSHGGIGVTMEYALGHYVKRLSVIEALFGDIDQHLVRFATLTAEAEQSAY